MSEMKFWKLEHIDNVTGSPCRYYAAIIFFVVRAENESIARRLASEQARDETAECWLNPEWSTCEEYVFPTLDGTAEVVWSEYQDQ